MEALIGPFFFKIFLYLVWRIHKWKMLKLTNIYSSLCAESTVFFSHLRMSLFIFLHWMLWLVSLAAFAGLSGNGLQLDRYDLG